MKDFLLITFGSSGDVNPFVGLGAALRTRGHTVTLATNPYFEKLIRQAGLDFVPMGTVQDFTATLDHPDLWHPRRGLPLVIRQGMIPLLRPSYELIRTRYQPGKTVVIASLLALGARIAQEKLGVPLVTVHLQPTAFPSLYQTPVYPQVDMSSWPRPLKRLIYWAGDWTVDRLLNPEFNRFRQELGLKPVRRIFAGWIHSPLLTLGLWPEWFSPPQPDWPKQARLSGFPLYDAAGVEPLPLELESFLQAGSAPVIFTPGSAMRQGKKFFEESLKACAQLGCRGLFLTKFPEQIPSPLPQTVRQFGYIPFSQVLPRAAAFVHHGGIGTTSQALAAGVPQLVMPLSHDQPDHAARVLRLGAGLVLKAQDYHVAAAVKQLRKLLENSIYKDTCTMLRKRLEGVNSLQKTCQLIESAA